MKQETIQSFFEVKSLCDGYGDVVKSDDVALEELCDKIEVCGVNEAPSFGQGFGALDVIEVMQDDVSDFVKMMRFGWLMDDSEYSELTWQEMNEKLEALKI